jgi:hypothetical protein
MVVVDPGGISLEELQAAAYSETSTDMRKLIERAYAALAP